ncbi:MAG TPA: L-seryl-tRNA(Sec) selenium transferase [Bryobacteraceae bacterium]|nr:L-seryl-tRNA(Sec) selenium transferase [Bryobacteraceae bacterium]
MLAPIIVPDLIVTDSAPPTVLLSGYLLREIPSVDDVLKSLTHLEGRFPRGLIVKEVRAVLARVRTSLLRGELADPTAVPALVERTLHRLEQPSLRRVINATGVVLHTNLGRAPGVPFTPLEGYSNLEYDVGAGRRGQRDIHIACLLERLTGRPGIAVNNNAAAIFLALNELAAGGEVVVSRGELIEIGDGFRIPDIMLRSGAVLREVGTTNRTRIEDYSGAINERTRLLLRVHPSNFRIQGFTSKPSLAELAALARERGIPLLEDLGSGCVADIRPFGIDEPLVSESLNAGVNLVTFSGDKLLGGPQAGILTGDEGLIRKLRRNPLYRALRLDKLITQALEATLRLTLLERWEQIPALAMLQISAVRIRARAENLVKAIRKDIRVEIIPGKSVAGGGSTPEQPLDTWLIAVHAVDVVDAERRCRAFDPPVIARIEDGLLLFDLRTVFETEEEDLARAISSAVKIEE